MTDSDACCNIRKYLQFPFFQITAAIASAIEERSISQIEDSLSEQVEYIYPAITPHKLNKVYSMTSWCILPPAHRLYRLYQEYSSVCVIGLGMKVIIECIIDELPAITITTITTATTTTTATIALDRDGCGFVIVVVGVLEGLGTGEAACWWYRDTVTTPD